MPDPSDANVVWMTPGEFDDAMRKALCDALEPGEIFGFNYSNDGDRIWIKAHPEVDGGRPRDTHALVQRARVALGR
jgi:hypothetical protein